MMPELIFFFNLMSKLWSRRTDMESGPAVARGEGWGGGVNGVRSTNSQLEDKFWGSRVQQGGYS